MRVVVSHPGRQHSHQLALGLAERDLLARYVTGVPCHQTAFGPFLSTVLRREIDARLVDLAPSLVEHNYVSTLLHRLARRAPGPIVSTALCHYADALFDWIVARQLPRFGADVVVAYEGGAMHTFRRAKALGLGTVLDAASFHHEWQDRHFRPVASPHSLARLRARKNAEVDLADLILTVSDLARSSYAEAGVANQRLGTVRLGVDTALFQPNSHQRDTGLLDVVFVGNLNSHKGLDLLLDAITKATASGIPVRLTAYGTGPLQKRLEAHPSCRWGGRLAQPQLARALSSHDILVLPSRFDSFGMVVPEAMACGLPVIVSDCVGARELVRPEANGLVVPAGSSAAIADALGWFVSHRGRFAELRAAARTTAESHSWVRYRESVGQVLVDTFATAAASPPIREV